MVFFFSLFFLFFFFFFTNVSIGLCSIYNHNLIWERMSESSSTSSKKKKEKKEYLTCSCKGSSVFAMPPLWSIIFYVNSQSIKLVTKNTNLI